MILAIGLISLLDQEKPKKIKKDMLLIQDFGLLIKSEVIAIPVIPLLSAINLATQQTSMQKLQMVLKLVDITLKPLIQHKQEQVMVLSLLNQLSLV